MQTRRILSAVLSALLLVAGGCGDRDPVADPDSGTGRAAPNLLLITLDTTRADRLGSYGYEQALTPALDGLASRGVVFDQAFANVPLTLPSHATIMTGLHPPEHGIRINGEDRLNLDQPVLAEVLRGHGYQTGAFVASFTLSSRNGLDVGFEVYDDDLSLAYGRAGGEQFNVYRSGKLVVDSALEWLAKREPERPFFGWVQLFDPHLPYVAHGELATTKFGEQASYDAEVAFMDAQVARLLSFLEAEDLTGSTVVIAVGDHGEGLGQHVEQEHGFTLYEETLRVPFIVSSPGKVETGHRVASVVSLVDVFGTALELLEVGGGETRSGRSLVPALHGSPIESVPAYGETDLPFTTFHWSPLRSLTTPDAKYIRSRRIHYYERGEDPGETKNLAPLRTEQVAELESRLAAIENAMTQGKAEPIRLSAEEIQQLEALGYVGAEGRSARAEPSDDRALPDFEDMIDVVDKFKRAGELGREKRYPEQAALFREMLARSPETVRFRRGLGTALMEAGELDEAALHMNQVVAAQPDNLIAHLSLGSIYRLEDDATQAVRHFSEAVRIDPRNALAHKGLAFFRGREGKFDEAFAHLSASLEANPKDDQLLFMRANLLERQGRIEDAVSAYREVLKLAPDSVPALNNLAWILATSSEARIRDGSEAVTLAVRASSGAGAEDPGILDTLAAAYAEAGRFPEAREVARKGLKLATTHKSKELEDVFLERLELYESEQPYHTPPRK